MFIFLPLYDAEDYTVILVIVSGSSDAWAGESVEPTK